MELSARNQVRGRVTGLKIGDVSVEVTVDIGGQEMVSVITRGSCERLGLHEGDPVTMYVKATEVIIGK